MPNTSAVVNPLIESRESADWRDITALLIVEPDIESWMPTAQALGQAKLILEKLDADESDNSLALHPRIWIGAVDDDDGLFAPEGRYANLHLHGVLADDEIWVFLRDILIGIARREPHAVVGLIGATREDEVQRVAEVVAGCGLRAVIVEPMCLSSALFFDLDEISIEANHRRAAQRVLTGEDESPLDELTEDVDDDEDVFLF